MPSRVFVFLLRLYFQLKNSHRQPAAWIHYYAEKCELSRTKMSEKEPGASQSQTLHHQMSEYCSQQAKTSSSTACPRSCEHPPRFQPRPLPTSALNSSGKWDKELLAAVYESSSQWFTDEEEEEEASHLPPLPQLLLPSNSNSDSCHVQCNIRWFLEVLVYF